MKKAANVGDVFQSAEYDRGMFRWTPSPKEFDAFCEREVEMCIENLHRGFKAQDLLHSGRTIQEAQRRMGGWS